MVGGGQTKPVAETQAAHAPKIKGIAVGNGSAFATISAGGRAAGAWVLAPIAYVVTGTLALSISIRGGFTPSSIQAGFSW